ncbi:MAG TPA: RDD family protein, partial [Burkholderiales bacterium]|nr:RDD family protein [Burkholderiales bacterium]
MLDTAREIPTPEGIELTLRLAGPVARALAWTVDLLVRTAAFGLLSIPLGMLGKVGVGFSLVLWFGLEWLYPTLFEVYGGGATPGKRALGLMVLHVDGTPVSLSA